MAKWSRKEIQDRALAELNQAGATGVRYMELAKRIHSAAPQTPFNTVVGSLHDLSLKNQEIVRPSRGFWVLKKYWEKEGGDSAPIDKTQETGSAIIESPTKNNSEESYYEPFVEWLLGQDQAIDAMVVGGNTFKNKWATPDVIGTYKPRKSDPVSFPIELCICRDQDRW